MEQLNREHLSNVRRNLAVAACALAFFMIAQDVQMVVAALPRLGHDLGLAPTSAVWLLLAGSITSTSLMLPAGRWADASGKRSAFLIAVLGYGVAAAAAASAQSLAWLLAARALSGAFLALILVLVMTVAVEAAGPTDRAKAVGVITAAGPLGSMTGPQIAAHLIPLLGWRSIFIVTVPLSLLAAALAWSSVPGELHLALPRRRWLVEAVALSLAVGSVFGLLREVPIGLDKVVPAVGLLLLVGAGAVAWTRLPQAKGIVRLVVARHLSLPLTSLALMSLATGVIAYTVPYFLIGDVRATLAESAVAFIALAFGQTLSSVVGGVLAGRLGAWPVAVSGAVLAAIGLALLVPLDPSWGVVGTAWRIGLVGLGAGLIGGCNQSTIMGLAPWHHEAAASAVSGAFRNLCYAMGAAVAATFASVAVSPTPGLRLALALAAAGAVGGLLAAIGSRPVMNHLDDLDHHPTPHHVHSPVAHLRGLAHDPEHPDYIEPELLVIGSRSSSKSAAD